MPAATRKRERAGRAGGRDQIATAVMASYAGQTIGDHTALAGAVAAGRVQARTGV